MVRFEKGPAVWVVEKPARSLFSSFAGVVAAAPAPRVFCACARPCAPVGVRGKGMFLRCALPGLSAVEASC
eukprot:2970827-Lingulodinium_polyedra.AAC.1